MNIYGVEIVSDVDFSLNFPMTPAMGHRLQLLSSVPAELRGGCHLWFSILFGPWPQSLFLQ